MSLTLHQYLTATIAQYTAHHLALGQIATTAHDEALYLILRTLNLPLDSDPSILNHRLTPAQLASLNTTFDKRIRQKIPAAYITREALLGDDAFYIDERALIPRSYFLELIPDQIPLAPDTVLNAADICTGSACLAILLAKHYPRAAVDAIDISTDALEVAKINIQQHRPHSARVTLHNSDLLTNVPPKTYDLIISNPPYEPTKICQSLPDEFLKEPQLALDGGPDGLDIIRRIITQTRLRLAPHGLLLIEVGALQKPLQKAYPKLPLTWLHTADDSNCICLIRAPDLQTFTQ